MREVFWQKTVSWRRCNHGFSCCIVQRRQSAYSPGNATPKHAVSSLRLQGPGKQDGSDLPVRNYSARAAAR